MSGLYMAVDEKGRVELGSNAFLHGPDQTPPAVTARCRRCGNTVQCQRGETILLDDPRLCEHIRAVGVLVSEEKQQ